MYIIAHPISSNTTEEGAMRQPTTQTINLSEVRKKFSQLLNQVHQGETRVVVEKSGIPVAAIVSAEDLAHLDRLEQERQERFQILDAIGAAFADVPPEELEQEVTRALQAVRHHSRSEDQAPRSDR
jgi:prevent-host-death family protein